MLTLIYPFTDFNIFISSVLSNRAFVENISFKVTSQLTDNIYKVIIRNKRGI